MALFSKELDSGQLNVHEMQTLWFEFQCGSAHYRLGEYRQALKQFGYVEKHIETIAEDCLEFNQYCFRKGTIN